MTYDTIIVGAGLGGLISGIELLHQHQKVLILEKNSLPGGHCSTFKRGRFEFNTSIQELYHYGNEEHVGKLKKYLDSLGLSLNISCPLFTTHIKTEDEKIDFAFSNTAESLFLEIEHLVPNSVDSLKDLLVIIKEIHEALERILANEEISEEKYPYFFKYLDSSAESALLDLNISKKAIDLLGYFWIDLGSPLHKLHFIDFSEMMYKLVFKKTAILKESNLSFILKLVDCYTSLGGEIYYRSCVQEIETLEDQKKVILNNGKIYLASHVICDLPNHVVFKELVKDTYPSINQLENARTLGYHPFVVYLALSESFENLKLDSYKYYHFESISSEKCIKDMNGINYKNYIGYVMNVVNEKASVPKTTILVLKTFYFGDEYVFDQKNYHRQKSEIAEALIRAFEEDFGVSIKEYIEEIEIATPYTYKKYTNQFHEGYAPISYDNTIHRILSYEDEKIPNLSIVGGGSILGPGIDNVIFGSKYIVKDLLDKEVES